MPRRALIQFSLLAAFWGASYLFIKVALEDGVGPLPIVFARTALAALVLLPLALARGYLGGIRSLAGPVFVLAFVQIAAPFTLISVGEQNLPSALTGILVATAPIFTFLLAFALTGEERAGGLSLLGVGVGVVGVALLLGVDAEGGAPALVGGLLVVLATTGYALGAWYSKRALSGVEPVGLAAATMAAAALMVAPFAALDLPGHAPSIEAAGSLVALGVLGTGVAFVFVHSLIAAIGPARMSLVAYVAPAFSVIYGVTLLGEEFGLATAAGLVLIVAGSWLAAEGRLPWARPAAAAEAA
ncbi:MAG TPA: DMT family transporter [Thermoleophilaceae bacterium]|nr:DMT family transporter [Thermoleophilaceae bacterium]